MVAVALADQLGAALALAGPDERERWRTIASGLTDRSRRALRAMLTAGSARTAGDDARGPEAAVRRVARSRRPRWRSSGSPKTIALAVFSSDALSSTAYATEEILFVVAVGASSLALGLSKLVPIAIVVAVLLAIVIVSYRQVIFAYPERRRRLRREQGEHRRDARRSSPARR